MNALAPAKQSMGVNRNKHQFILDHLDIGQSLEISNQWGARPSSAGAEVGRYTVQELVAGDVTCEEDEGV